MLRALNPQYKRDIVPGNNGARPLLLPATNAYAFVSLEDTIYRYKSEEFFVNRSYVEPGGSTGSRSSSQERVVHRVRPGETMNAIANKYGVTTTQIRKWNGLKSSKVNQGTRLTLYIDNGGIPIPKEETSTDSASAPKTATASTATPKATAPKTAQTSGNAGYTKYKVKPGDTFSSIAQKYPGVTVKKLMEFNNMNKSKLVVGQIIKIPTV